MQLHPLKLVTIVTEPVLKDHLLPKIIELGATGYTCYEATGFGSRGARKDFGGENMRIDVVCSPDVADAILTFISHNYFENYACITWVIDVSVVRGARYMK
ncbi:MAG: hypothetical protein P4L84_13010 [Isosphaeraceae bacterium]|nr:hypothetical protein [Isosphaeraceae bacterium]